MKCYHNLFSGMAQNEALFQAWEGFRMGKSGRKDVQEFEQNVEQHIFSLGRELRAGSYRHGAYHPFTICDPKQRLIQKATVRDRIIHHAVFSALNPVFEPTFFTHSYSCRTGKGTHRAMRTLHGWLRAVSHNDHRKCFVLQCDIHKFFASVSHALLFDILRRRIKDPKMLWILQEIIGSVQSGHLTPTGHVGMGIPIGNLTSQLFANVYLNELDVFLKHELKLPHYVRYTDDFAIVADNREELDRLIKPIRTFLQGRLHLDLHPRKVTIRTFRQGIDFLGYVLLPHHRVLRTRTKRRMYRKMRERIIAFKAGTIPAESVEQSLQSYLGVLSHADSYRLSEELQNQCWYWLSE